MHYGKSCQKLREERGMSTFQASVASGIPEPVILAVENGLHDLKAEQVIALAAAYDVPTDALLSGGYSVSMETWGKVESLCEWLKISKSKAYRLVKEPVEEGGVPTHMIGGSARVYKPEVFAWALSQQSYADKRKVGK